MPNAIDELMRNADPDHLIRGRWGVENDGRGGIQVVDRWVQPAPPNFRPARVPVNPMRAVVDEMQDLADRVDRELIPEHAEQWIAVPAGIPKAPPKVLKRIDMSKNKDYTVAQYFGQKEKNGTFGVEIEVEGNGLPQEISPYVVAKADGSLRGESLEYVFAEPLPKDLTFKVLDEIVDTLKKKSVLDMSFRTSVHVHVNVQKMTRTQLCCYLYLAFLFEDALVKYSGEHRVGNRFCLRVRDAYGKVRELEHLFFNSENIMIQEQGQVKYSAINLATIKRYGSVEFRSMRGVVDKKILKSWIEILDRIYVASAAFDKPIDIAREFQKDPVVFAERIFGNSFKLLNYPEIKDDMMDAYTHLISLPHEFKE